MSKEKNTTCFCSSTFSVNGEQLHAVCSLLGQCTYKNGNTKWCSIESYPRDHCLHWLQGNAISRGKMETQNLWSKILCFSVVQSKVISLLLFLLSVKKNQ